jgi:hypothetical protein
MRGEFMDFYQIRVKVGRDKLPRLYPDFKIGRSKDLMVRGRGFYAIWDADRGLWSTDEYDVQRLVDESLHAYSEKHHAQEEHAVSTMGSFDSNSWTQYRRFLSHVSDNSHDLDSRLTFANTEVKKGDHVSKRLPYSLAPGDYSAWDELVGTLYAEEERRKIEWAIGAIIAGDARHIQKFLVLYGPAGTGKSTILNVVERLFEGYTAVFEAKALGSNNNAFATEAFRSNPLVAIQHDGDLSKIEDNTKLNSIIAHEDIVMNEKYKPSYMARVNAFLWMGTNQPVKISDAKSGIIRRLIDVHPTGTKIPVNHYHALMSQVDFQLGAIAEHCLAVYRHLGRNYYNGYQPLEMMFQTDIFFNFIEANYDIFKGQDYVTLRQAYQLYKEYCAETGIDRPLPQYRIRDELRNYFDEFKLRHRVDGKEIRSVYVGFNANKFKSVTGEDRVFSLVVEDTVSLLDEVYEYQPAQYAGANDLPKQKWDVVKTQLADIDTSKLHYVLIPEQHIVIDFDIRDSDGEKSLELNLRAASDWPGTYAELSKSGSGVHLHYIYEGDVTQLAAEYSNGIEIKTLLGSSSLRRRLSKCNTVPIAILKGGLPTKEKKLLNTDVIQSERGLRQIIARNLNKEIHPGTKSSVDFIHKILEDAYESGLAYDVTDLRPRIIAFANNSSNQPLQALKVVQLMKFKSRDEAPGAVVATDERLVFFDVEVYSNLFVICWKYQGDSTVVRMINPSPLDVERLFSMRLVGFNNRRYDNHIIYARVLGYDNEQLYKLSQKIISGSVGSMFGEAYNLSFSDIYDFSSKKQGLKKFQIDLGILHKEMDIPWDQPVPEDRIADIVEYCVNDVISTEAVFESRKQDFVARQILSELSELSVNDTTQKHTARIVFGSERHHASFVYTDLRKQFPGYVFERGKSTYNGEEVGEGGYVYSEPGMYENVAMLDVVSMHPTSIELLNLFGDFTPRFSALKAARVAIKRKEYSAAKKMLGGKLAPYLGDPEQAEALAYALKIIINIVYGLTSAKFDNAFRDVRNVDNIVAKRGALFMIDVRNAVQERGYTVAHIKTDSIKIPNADADIIAFVKELGKKYGYEFEHETTYDKLCLVNDAVYIARKGDAWTAVGAQFQHPIVYKTLFSGEPLVFEDFCETKSVTQGAMYLDFGLDRAIFMPGEMTFVGRTGQFVAVGAEIGGGILYRVKDDKFYAVSGTKGFLWMEASIYPRDLFHKTDLDNTYYDKLVYEARTAIDKFGSYDEFVAPITSKT